MAMREYLSSGSSLKDHLYLLMQLREETNSRKKKSSRSLDSISQFLLSSKDRYEAKHAAAGVLSYHRSFSQIDSEARALPFEKQRMFAHLRSFVCLYSKMILGKIERKVVDYLDGSGELVDVEITKQNAREVLDVVKLVDLAVSWFGKISKKYRLKFVRSTYDLRTHILKLASPSMTTCEAYTRTLNPANFLNTTHLKDPDNWISETTGHHLKLVANDFVKALALSTRLNEMSPLFGAMRGLSASGKTTLVNEFFCGALDSNQKLSGCLTSDPSKAIVKRTMAVKYNVKLVNRQVHDEIYALFDTFYTEMMTRKPQLNKIVDLRLLRIEYLDVIIESARKENANVVFLDIDVPLKTALVRNLVRDPYGQDPCVPLEAFTTGFVELRQHRPRFIERIKKENIIKDFRLFFTDDKGIRHLIAIKKEGNFTILSKTFFDESLRLPSADEINTVVDEMITPEFVNRSVITDISPRYRHLLEKWIGKTLKDALSLHVNGNT